VARVLKAFFEERGLPPGELAPEAPQELNGISAVPTVLRGLAFGTIADHLTTVSEFLQFVADKTPAVGAGQVTPFVIKQFPLSERTTLTWRQRDPAELITK
jgi:hypothetical protein